MALAYRQKLQRRKEALTNKIKILREQQARAQLEADRHEKILAGVNNKIEQVDTGIVAISEHAQLQYLSRICGIDLEQIKEAILPARHMERILRKGEGKHRIGDHTIAVINGVVATVYEAKTF